MKQTKSIISFILISNILFFLSISFNKIETNENLDKNCEESDDMQPSDWLYAQRVFPYDKINREAYMEAMHQAQSIQNQPLTLRNNAQWILAGPTNAGGRISSLAAHPSDAQTIYIGAAAGGVFKTTDGGGSWTPIFDANSSLSIGDIAIAPTNKDILYVGTGEANGGGGSINFDGLGVFKSTNGGINWQNIGLENVGSIGKVAIDPQNSNRVFVAAMGTLYDKNPNRGIYRTTDGGGSWQKVLYVSDSTGCVDVAINPQSPNILLATMWERIRRPNYRDYGGSTCGVYRSLDDGDTWEKMTNGLPTTNIGRMGVAISPADPSVSYTIIADEIGFFKGIYKSTDNGSSWTKLDSNNNLSFMYSSFGWWFGKIIADPVDVNTVYALGVDINKTSDGGQTWRTVSSGIHVDQHALWINPNNSNQVYAGNDGGFYTSDNATSSWVYKNNLPITQFYTSEIDEKNPQRLYGGTQDNGTWRALTGGVNDWQQIYGADGFVCLVDPLDNNFIYSSYQNGNLLRSVDGGRYFDFGVAGVSPSDRKNWKTPIILAPDNPSTLYYGSNRLYRSTDRAATWRVISPNLTNGAGGGNLTFGTLTAIAVSPKNTQIIYTGADDGNVWVTSDGGTNWSKITNGLPNRWVTSIAADPFDENTAYITFSGYKWWDYQPHVMKTTNKGSTWTDISSNLPQAPVNDFVADPQVASSLAMTADVFYVATDFGVYATYNGGASWAALGTGLPLVSVMDLTLHNGSRTLAAATHGRSMYRINLPTAAPNLSIGGSIRRELGDTVAAQIFLYKNALFQALNSSLFNFNNLPNFQNYEVKPYRNDKPLQGVTTFDIALISRHILGIEPLSTPYKIIAADANHDNEVDATDMLLLRKLILRQIDTLPNNTAWRFVPKNYVFSNPQNPFSPIFYESILFNNLNENIANADFYAIKIGDVNNSANLSIQGEIKERNDDKILIINILDKILEKDKAYKIPLAFNNLKQIVAFQLAFNWDKNAVENIQIQAGDLPSFNASNYAIFKEKNVVAIAWNGDNLVENDQEKIILNLVIQPKKMMKLSEILTQNDAHTEGVSYAENGEAFPLKLNFISPKKEDFTLYQNYPNPFGFETKIPFDLPKNGAVHLTISDLSGRVLEDFTRSFLKGFNEIIYQPKENNRATGILIYRLETAQGVKTQMMFFEK